MQAAKKKKEEQAGHIFNIGHYLKEEWIKLD